MMDVHVVATCNPGEQVFFPGASSSYGGGDSDARPGGSTGRSADNRAISPDPP